MTMPSLKTRPAVSDGLDVVDGLDVAVAVVDVVGPTSRARKNKAEIYLLQTAALLRLQWHARGYSYVFPLIRFLNARWNSIAFILHAIS